MTALEAAAILGICDSEVRRYCRAGRLGTKQGRDWWITEAELRRFKKKKRPRGNPDWVK